MLPGYAVIDDFFPEADAGACRGSTPIFAPRPEPVPFGQKLR